MKRYVYIWFKLTFIVSSLVLSASVTACSTNETASSSSHPGKVLPSPSRNEVVSRVRLNSSVEKNAQEMAVSLSEPFPLRLEGVIAS